MEGERIEIPTQCQPCESHKTDLGTLKMLEASVVKNFSDWSKDKQCDLILSLFRKTYEEGLASDEKNWKKEMAEQIRKDKRANIREMNK
jgi:hypothetical protein